MLRLAELSVLLIFALNAQADPADPTSPPPILSTVTIPTTFESLSTFTSVVASTSVQKELITVTTNIGGNNVVSVSTGQDQTTVIQSTSIGVSTIMLTSSTVVVSTVGFSATSTSASASSATPIATSASLTSSPTSKLTDALRITSTASDLSSTTQTSQTQSHSSPPSSTSRTSSTSSSTSSAASTTPAHRAESKGGMSTGAKAGIGVGIALGVIILLLLLAVLILWRHGLLSRKAHNADVADPEDDAFLQRPYSMLFNQKKQLGIDHEKPEDATAPAYTRPNARLSSGIEMSGTTIPESADEEPVYLAVPAHMSGARRWSKVPSLGEA